VIDAIADGDARAEPQVGDVTLAPKLTLEDGRIDWHQHASTVLNLIRGTTPEPGAFTTVDGLRLKVLEASIDRDAASLEPGSFALVDGSVLVGTLTQPVRLQTVLPAGKRAMPATDWWRGRASTPDTATVAE